MSEIKVNKITPRVACGTTQLGDSGDTFTIPSGATITNSGTASGFGATGETSWDTTVKTTGTFTATAGVGYFLNTTAGQITVNLPAGTAGDSVALADYAATWQTNKVNVNANGSEKIGGIASVAVTLNTEGQSVTFVYVDSTQGWVNVLDSTSNVRANEYLVATGGTISCCGNDKIHKFTGPGTFTVCTAAICAANNLVSYMVVAGGGGGGGHGGAGGGAGGFRELKSPSTPYTASPLDGYPSAPNRITVSASPGSYPIVVGAGGAGGCCQGGTQGDVSTFDSITSTGGGYGGGGAPSPTMVGGPGGSGGGGGGNAPGNAGGSGNTPTQTPAQGTGGGAGTSPHYEAGGGGGATVAGTAGTPGPAGPAGPGGAGATSSIDGTPTARAGGGGGSSQTYPAHGSGGLGGGGDGINCATCGAGTINTGGGGGGIHNSAPHCGGLGGSGIVIIRYRYK